MAIAIVEELWTRIRAAIDDKIVAAEDAAASAEADRVVVEQAATSASWSGDRLTVLGATSPSLTGPQGPEGPQGPKGDSGDGAGDVLWSELTPALDGKAPVSHDHTIAQVAGLQDELDGKAPATHQHAWGDVTGKPTVYPPESHTHPQSEVEGLEAALAGKASTDHSHSEYATTTAVDGVSGRVTTLESSAPIIVSSLPASPLPGRIYLVTG